MREYHLDSQDVSDDNIMHRGPDSMYLGDTTINVTPVSDAVAYTRPTFPSIRSFDRLPLRHGPSEIAIPQTEINMRCGHMPSICLDRPSANELPLAYANLVQPWKALNKPHWDFVQDNIIGE